MGKAVGEIADMFLILLEDAGNGFLLGLEIAVFFVGMKIQAGGILAMGDDAQGKIIMQTVFGLLEEFKALGVGAVEVKQAELGNIRDDAANDKVVFLVGSEIFVFKKLQGKISMGQRIHG